MVKEAEDATFSPNLARKHTVTELITGYGVAEAVRHYYRLWPGTDVRGQRAIIQGWGNVGAATYYLAGQDVRIVGAINRVGGLLNANGFGLEEIRELLLARKGHSLPGDTLLSFEKLTKPYGRWGPIFLFQRLRRGS